MENYRQHGFVVVRGAVPVQLCDDVIHDIWGTLGLRPDRPAKWYRTRPADATRSGARHPTELGAGRAQQDLEVSMLSLWQSDACWATRYSTQALAIGNTLLYTPGQVYSELIDGPPGLALKPLGPSAQLCCDHLSAAGFLFNCFLLTGQEG